MPDMRTKSGLSVSIAAPAPVPIPASSKPPSRFGKVLAENDIRLVYGGGSIGLMGAVATSVLDHGGIVTGIIPDFLTSRENALTRVQEMIVTPDMHERKRLMFERSDAFVALPGGVGTLEELVEQLTWQQLGRHSKPVLLANIDGFWEPLLALLAHMRATEFIRPSLAVDILKADRVEDILPRLRAAAARVPEGAEELAPKSRAGCSLHQSAGTSPPRCDCRRDRARRPHNIARVRAAAARARHRIARRHSAPRRERHRHRRSISRAGRCGRRCPV